MSLSLKTFNNFSAAAKLVDALSIFASRVSFSIFPEANCSFNLLFCNTNSINVVPKKMAAAQPIPIFQLGFVFIKAL